MANLTVPEIQSTLAKASQLAADADADPSPERIAMAQMWATLAHAQVAYLATTTTRPPIG